MNPQTTQPTAVVPPSPVPATAPAAVTPPVVPAAPVVDPPKESPYISKLFDAAMGKKDPKKESAEPPKEPDPKEVADPAAKVEEPKEPEPKVEPKPAAPKKTRVGPKPRTDSDIVAVAAAAATKAIEESKAKEKAAPPEPAPVTRSTEVEIPDMFSKRAEVFKALADIDPEKYGGGKIQQILKKSAADIHAYAKAYTAENNGKRFNPSDPEHAEAIEELSPNIDEDDMVSARVAVQTAKAVEAQVKPLREQIEARKQQEEVAAILDTTSKIAQSSAGRVLETALSEFDSELATASRNTETMEAYSKANPGMFKIAKDVSSRYIPLVYRAIQMMSPGGDKTVNGKNPLDPAVFDMLLPAVDRFALTSDGEGVDEHGRQYVALADFIKLSPNEAKEHWTVTPKLIEKYAAVAIKSEMESERKAFESQISAMGYVKKAPVSAPAAQSKEEKPPAIAVKVTSPSTSGGGPAITSGTPEVAKKNVYDRMFERTIRGA